MANTTQPTSATPHAGAGGAWDIGGAVVAWTLLFRYAAHAKRVYGALIRAGRKGSNDLRHWLGKEFGKLFASSGWLIALGTFIITWASYRIFNLLHGWTNVQPQWSAYAQIGTTVDYVLIVSVISLVIQVTSAVREWERILVFLIATILEAVSLFALAVMYAYYAFIFGLYASQQPLGMTGLLLVLPLALLMLSAILAILALIPMYALLEVLGWALALVISAAETGAGTVIGVGGGILIPGQVLQELRSIIGKVHETIDEGALRKVISSLIPNTWRQVFAFCVLTAFYPHPLMAFLVAFAGAVTSATAYIAVGHVGNVESVREKQRKFALFMFIGIAGVLVIWTTVRIVFPGLIVGIVDGVGWLWSQPRYLVCVMKGLATSVAWLKYILAVLGAVVAFLVLLSIKNAKDTKGVTWRLATALLGIPFLGAAAFLILGSVIATDSMNTLACKGCGLPSTPAATISITPTSTPEPNPAIKGWRPSSTVTPRVRRDVAHDQAEARALGLE